MNQFSKREEEILAFWQKNKIFEKTLERTKGAKPFVYYDGPPFATGLPHFGHLLPTSLKDCIPRYQTMKGRYVERQWGWDCHGLPIENLIQKELNLPTKKDIEQYGVDKFSEAAQASVLRFDKEWKAIIPRVGRFVDMEHAYKTLEPNFTESGWWAFKTLNQKGLVYEGFRVMHISPLLETPLSNLEVSQNYKDITDLSAYVRFKVLESNSKNSESEEVSLIAWTTTPWTLPANTALAVSPKIEYVKIHRKENDEKIIVAKSRLEALANFIGQYEILETISGAQLEGLKYQPLYDYYAKDTSLKNHANGWQVYCADFVTDESGTGIVHIAPAFGEDDLALANEKSLPFVQHVGINGLIKDEVPEFAGRQAKPKDDPSETDVEFIKDLAHRGALFAKEKINHSYPHCWRTDAPLLNYAMNSWFIKVSDYRERMVQLNKEVNWVPKEIGSARFENWLENARDWNVSRSRFWGAPLPVWKSEDGMDVEFIGSLSELKEKTRGLAKFYTMRHAESKGNILDVASSKPNPEDGLTENGKTQALSAVSELKTLNSNIKYIYTSGLTRATETAEIVRAELGLAEGAVIVDERISEFLVGDFDGKKWDLFRERLASIDLDLQYQYVFPNGESYADVKKRAMDFIFDIDAKHRNEDCGILIVAHGAPLGMLHAGSAMLQENKIWPAYASDLFVHKNAEIKHLDFAPFSHDKNFILDLHRPYIDEITWQNADGKIMKRIPEVFDTWFDSGSVPFAKWHYPFENKEEFEKQGNSLFPADFIAEGLDQTRGWFYSLLELGTMLFDKVPYKNVVVNGLVLAEDGQKMSKSKNNFPPVMDTIDQYSVDALRYFLLSSPAVKAEDVAFSVRNVDDIQKKLIARFRNVVSFYEMYANENDSKETIEACRLKAWSSPNILDKWILARLAEDCQEVTNAMEEYRIDRAIRPALLFVDDLSTWYLRRSRERCKTEGVDRDFAIATTRYVCATFSKLLAPFVPFLAEDVYLRVTHNLEEESVHLESWPDLSDFASPETLKTMSLIREVVSLGLEARAKSLMKVRQPLQSITLSEKSYKSLDDQKYFELILDELNVKEVKFGDVDTVLLETNLTEELIAEGYVREFTRTIQSLRKESGLSPDDKISLTIEADDNFNEIVKRYEEVLKSAVSAEAFEYRALKANDQNITPFEAGDMKASFVIKVI